MDMELVLGYGQQRDRPISHAVPTLHTRISHHRLDVQPVRSLRQCNPNIPMSIILKHEEPQTLPARVGRLLPKFLHEHPQELKMMPMRKRMFLRPGSICKVLEQRNNSNRERLSQRTRLCGQVVLLHEMLPVHNTLKSQDSDEATLPKPHGSPVLTRIQQTKEGGSHKQRGRLRIHMARAHAKLLLHLKPMQRPTRRLLGLKVLHPSQGQDR